MVGRGRKSTPCPGRGGRLSSGGPGVERAAWYRAVCWDTGALRVGLPALGGERPAGSGRCPPMRPAAKEQPAAVHGGCFVGGILRARRNAGPAVRQDGGA